MFTSWGYFRCLGVVAALVLVACGGSSGGHGPGASGSGGSSQGGKSSGGGPGKLDGGAGGADDDIPSNDCDDNVLCTFDERVDGTCTHTPQHFMCLGGSYCSLTEGCALGNACATDDDCMRPDNCVTVTCDPKSARCAYHYLDSDEDGETPLVCGGKDCNDAEFWVHSDAPETCDGLDNDCDGVRDPAKDSKCLSGESCVLGKCECDAGATTCALGSGVEARGCFDLQSDAEHCGSCPHACVGLETCKQGQCACEAPLSRCSDNVCHDLSADKANCGACGVDCGNGACQAGECVCPANTENCGSAQAFDCRDTQTDGNNCGSCGKACGAGSGCANAKCDAEVEYVRMYGTPNQGKPTYGATLPMATDTKGNLFAAFNGGGEMYELPNGAAPAWTGPFVIAKLDAQANVLWTVPSSYPVTTIASAGDDLWVAVNASTDVSINGQIFTRKADHQHVIAMVKLKGTTGEVLAHEQLDLPASGGGIWLTADTDGAWVAFDTTGNVGHGAGSFTQPAGYYYLLYATSSGATRWLPGYPSNLTLDSNKKVFVAITADPATDVTLGGTPFSPTAKLGQWAMARYTKALVHEASVMFPVSFSASAVAPDATTVFWTNGSDGLLQENDYAGALIGAQGPITPSFGLYSAQLKGNKVYAFGGTGATASTYLNRSLPAYQVMFAKFDKTTRALENSITLATDKLADTYGSTSSAVVTDNGNAAVLAVGFDEAISFTGGNTYDAPGKSGVAFVKVKLPAP